MTYSQQSFSVSEILNSSEMDQLEFNIRDHVHGNGNISHRIGASFYTDETKVIESGIVKLGVTLIPRYSNGVTLGSSGQIFVTHSGWYEVKTKLAIFRVQSIKSVVDTHVYKNESSEIKSILPVNAISENDIMGIGFVYLNPDDYIDLRIFAGTNDISVVHNITNTFINMVRM